MAVLDELTKVFKLKLKTRNDDLLDHYSRLFMVRVFLALTLLCGMKWYNDDFNCFIPKKMKVGDEFKSFVQRSCWIQGLYVYRRLGHYYDESAYFGVSKDIDHDGILAGTDQLCVTSSRLWYFKKSAKPGCKEMNKTFFLQYQYLPFFLAFLSMLYYLPYMVHKMLNKDVLKLQTKLSSTTTPDAGAVFKRCFQSGKTLKQTVGGTEGRASILYSVLGNWKTLVIKLLYLTVNLFGFLSLDSLLEDRFVGYGNEWLKWSRKKENDVGKESRDFLTPGNELLPPFGYCELYSSAVDLKQSHANKFKFVCEISTHVLYQYAFLLLWFLFITGICVSLFAVLLVILKIVRSYLRIKLVEENFEIEELYNYLPYKHVELLEIIKTKNLILYNELLTLFLQALETKKLARFTRINMEPTTSFALNNKRHYNNITPQKVQCTSMFQNASPVMRNKHEYEKFPQLQPPSYPSDLPDTETERARKSPAMRNKHGNEKFPQLQPPSYPSNLPDTERPRNFTIHEQADLVVNDVPSVAVARKLINP